MEVDQDLDYEDDQLDQPGQPEQPAEEESPIVDPPVSKLDSLVSDVAEMKREWIRRIIIRGVVVIVVVFTTVVRRLSTAVRL
jgi:hypothetical protein